MASDALRFLQQTDGIGVTCTCDILDKESSIVQYVDYMLSRTNEIFEYHNLPESIPAQYLELYLQLNGSCAIAKYGDFLYAFVGRAGGPPDPYYRPTHYVVANPGLNFSSTYRILNHLPPFDSVNWTSMEPCVYIRNDTRARGLLPLFSRYATQLAENDVSIRSAQINARAQMLISASTTSEIAAANEFIDGLVDGKLQAVGEKAFLEGIRAQNISTMSSNTIIQLIELQQYLKASWYNELGLNSNFNMKREYLSAEEIKASTDTLLPLIDDMYKCRQEAIALINEIFNLDIEVSKSSAWQNKQEESEGALDPDEEVESTEPIELNSIPSSDPQVESTEPESEEPTNEEVLESDEPVEEEPEPQTGLVTEEDAVQNPDVPEIPNLQPEGKEEDDVDVDRVSEADSDERDT